MKRRLIRPLWKKGEGKEGWRLAWRFITASVGRSAYLDNSSTSLATASNKVEPLNSKVLARVDQVKLSEKQKEAASAFLHKRGLGGGFSVALTNKKTRPRHLHDLRSIKNRCAPPYIGRPPSKGVKSSITLLTFFAVGMRMYIASKLCGSR